MSESIFLSIKSALIKTLNLSQEMLITESTKLKDDLGLDSMSTLSFLMVLEENIEGFAVDPDTLDIAYLETVGTVEEYIRKQLKVK